MKILHVVLSGCYTDNLSYQENYLPKYHKIQGFDVEIITNLFVYNNDGQGLWLPEPQNYVNDDGVEVIRLKLKPSKINGILRRYIGFKEALEKSKPDIIFVHGVQFADSTVVVEYCKRHPEVTVYADNHADFSNSATNWISKNILHEIVWRHYAQKLKPCVKKFYGVLPARVDFLVNEYKLPREKTELLVMGADDECVEKASKPEVRKNIREKYGISQDDFVIMTGGKIDAFKTQTLLLMEAVHKIENPKVKLLVFGSVTPELKDKVEALSDGEKVKYIGWVQSKDSYDYFAASDLVVFPGRHSVFWEQVAAQGKPMVVKYWDGTTHVDVCGNVEFLYKDSTEEIKEKIENIIEPANYSVMKEKAEKASEHFVYSKIAKRSIAE